MTRLDRPCRFVRPVLLAGFAALALAACSPSRGQLSATDYSALPPAQGQMALGDLTARYKANPKDRVTAIRYAAALRAAGQPQQAASALETTMSFYKNDMDLSIAYAKALTAAGRFDQSINVIDRVIRPEAPDWNALLVKGATLDQMGRNQEARVLYQQAAAMAPGEASIETNIGLSYAMTNDLDAAEKHLRAATKLRGASTQTRQNLALVVGLQGRFAEAEALYAAELPPEQVASNMAYVRALLTQQNRWDALARS